MGAISGIELLKWFRKQCPDTPVVLLTAFGSVETAWSRLGCRRTISTTRVSPGSAPSIRACSPSSPVLLHGASHSNPCGDSGGKQPARATLRMRTSNDGYGASAPAARLFKEFGFTVDNVVAKALALVKP